MLSSILLVAMPLLAAASPVALEARAGNTQNDLVNGVCKPVSLIYARGSTETGNFGSLVGPQFLKALQSAIGASNIAAQGVEYPASLQGNLPNAIPNVGPQYMLDTAAKAIAKCQGTQIVFSGYSQGGAVVHNATMLAGPNSPIFKSLKAVVLFGDTYNTKPVQNIDQSIVLKECNDKDQICHNTLLIGPAHLSYNDAMASAAAFVKSHVKV